MAKTYTLTSDSYQGRYLELVCTQVPNPANNTSTINWTLSAKGGSSTYYSTGATTAKIGSNTVYSKSRVEWDSKVFPAAKGSTSGSITVQHNTDGKLSLSVSLATAIHTATVTTKSGTWTLDTNPRGATITAAPNFTDEESPTISYTNHSGSSVTSIQACIANTDGTTIYVPYRDINKTGTSYTFTLTDAERNTLRNATPNSKTMKVKFYIQTIISGNTYRDSVEKTLTITNANPTLNPSVYDTNASTIALTGDKDNKVIKYYSDMQCTSGAAAVKGASIKSIKIECGSKSRTSNGVIENVESGSFKFTVTDSRGNTATQTVTKTLINYVKLTCNLEMKNPNPAGTVDLNISGNGFSGSFGAVDNTISVSYRYKEDVSGAAWSDYIAVSATRSGSNYTAKATVTGLDYTKRYVFQASANDKLASANSQERKVKTTPIFDWGEEDFNFNVPVNINGDLIVNGYNLAGAAKAMTNSYNLTTTYTAATGYTNNATANTILIGNSIRCSFDVTRSAAITGNVANEKVITMKIKHDGKIKSLYSDVITSSVTGAVTTFYINNSSRDDTYVTFDIMLAATTNSGSAFNAYFTLPCTLNLDKF